MSFKIDRVKEMLESIKRIESRIDILRETQSLILEEIKILTGTLQDNASKPKATTEIEPEEKAKPKFIVVKTIIDYISKAGTNLSYKLIDYAGKSCYIAKIHVESVSDKNTRLTVLPGKEWVLESLEWK